MSRDRAVSMTLEMYSLTRPPDDLLRFSDSLAAVIAASRIARRLDSSSIEAIIGVYGRSLSSTGSSLSSMDLGRSGSPRVSKFFINQSVAVWLSASATAAA